MALDLSLAANVAEKVILLVAGAVVARVIQRRPRLIAFYGHVGEFRIMPKEQPEAESDGDPAPPPSNRVHTHTVVIRNAGSLPSRNVRVPHRGALAEADIHVSVQSGVKYERSRSDDGEDEFLFPVLAPKQQVTISYLYFPPITWNNINLPVTSDEGLARGVSVLPTIQPPKWLAAILWALVVLGGATLLYGVVEAYRWVNSTGL